MQAATSTAPHSRASRGCPPADLQLLAGFSHTWSAMQTLPGSPDPSATGQNTSRGVRGAAMAGYKIEIVSEDERHWWRIVAGNGEIVASSETYTTRQAAEKTVAAVVEAITEKVRQALHQAVVVEL